MESKLVSLVLMSLLVLAVNTQNIGQNLVVNGDFSNSSCTGSWCVFTRGQSKNFWVTGWQAQPQIEVGRGNVYSQKFSRNEWVTELDPDTNSCIYQSLGNLIPGIYTLSFQHAARQGRSYQDTQFTVSVDGIFQEMVYHTDYERQRKSYNVRVANPYSNVGLRLCGAGKSSSQGAIVTNIAFRLTGGITVGPSPTYLNYPVYPTYLSAPGAPSISRFGFSGYGFPGAGSGYSVTGSGYQGTGSGYPVLGSGYPGTGYSGTGSNYIRTGY